MAPWFNEFTELLYKASNILFFLREDRVAYKAPYAGYQHIPKRVRDAMNFDRGGY